MLNKIVDGISEKLNCPFPRKKAETAAKIYEINEGKR